MALEFACRTAVLIGAVAAGAGLQSCSDLPSSTSTRPSTPIHESSLRSLGRLVPPISIDDKFMEIATKEPSFGGLFFDRGNLVVVLTDTTRPSELVRSAITASFDDPRLATKPITVRRGDYGLPRSINGLECCRGSSRLRVSSQLTSTRRGTDSPWGFGHRKWGMLPRLSSPVLAFRPTPS